MTGLIHFVGRQAASLSGYYMVLQGAFNKAFSKEEDGDDVSELVEEEAEDKSHISRIQV
jgi:hypothetical protein